LHARPEGQGEKIAAAYKAGCRRFDGAIGGHGGCPFAEDEMVGNINTHALIEYLESVDPGFQVGRDRFNTSASLAQTIFS
jgi:hydroxymethylglutaryl-CoA lyase